MNSPFDDLARTLATPMPRRRALRSLGAALAISAIPALRPARAAATGECPGTTKLCFVKLPMGGHSAGCYYPTVERCCIGPNNDSQHPNKMSWICDKDEGCGEMIPGGDIKLACTCSNRCKDGKCCPRSKGRCVDGTCCPAKRTTFAPGTNGKGVACCPAGTIAVPGRTGQCCPKGDMTCCDPEDTTDDDLLAPLGKKLKRGQLCVKGKVRTA